VNLGRAGPAILLGVTALAWLTSCGWLNQRTDGEARRRVDPAAWGADHVGLPMPEYVTGDECLFCHRDIGPTWGDNRHQLTIRPVDPSDPAVTTLRQLAGGSEAAADTRYLMGSQNMTRFLKKSQAYGQLEILTASYRHARDNHDSRIDNNPGFHWDKTTFADRCAGCHTTAVDTATRAFSALSLDCYTCHGEVPLTHTENIDLAPLSKTYQDPRHVTSICAQCHLRGGRSSSTGLLYPNNFVPGDNLFRDFRVDWSDAFINAQPAPDRHIYLNARDVVVYDQQGVTCLSCHDVHDQDDRQHQQLADHTLCASCHVPDSEYTELIYPRRRSARVEGHSPVCDY
jgi:hypothetical protein